MKKKKDLSGDVTVPVKESKRFEQISTLHKKGTIVELLSIVRENRFDALENL